MVDRIWQRLADLPVVAVPLFVQQSHGSVIEGQAELSAVPSSSTGQIQNRRPD